MRLQRVRNSNINDEPEYAYQSVTQENWKDIEADAWIILPNGTSCQKSVCVYGVLFGEAAARRKFDELDRAIEYSVGRERNACARLAEEMCIPTETRPHHDNELELKSRIARAIRARGKTNE